jgi:hypothetical protein
MALASHLVVQGREQALIRQPVQVIQHSVHGWNHGDLHVAHSGFYPNTLRLEDDPPADAGNGRGGSHAAMRVRSDVVTTGLIVYECSYI